MRLIREPVCVDKERFLSQMLEAPKRWDPSAPSKGALGAVKALGRPFDGISIRAW